MTLAAGTKLGPYEIVSPLGAGGMGEVYRAKDTRLGREVAVKVLPASFAAEAERLRRFEQEARATGALNHPNILAIYDVGSADGAPYLVSELLEGETLRKRMSESALPLRKALEFGMQIANGLAAAHEKGIVHRDLKPENLFVTRDSRIKILDFGLAKLERPEPADGATLTAATAAAREEVQTNPGAVLGTVGYMSPEQVRAIPADSRSDIFSFGTILYEMVSGERPFRAGSSVETMNAILKEDPPEISSANRNVPAAVERVIRRSLEKSPDERFQSARDLGFALEALSGTSTGMLAKPVDFEKPEKQSKVLRFLSSAILFLLVVAGAFLGGIWMQARFETAVTTWTGTALGGPGTAFGVRLSPDGKTLAFLAMVDGLTQVAVMNPASGNWTILTHDRTKGSADTICWSRDGTKIYFSRVDPNPRGIFSVPSLGGEERMVLEDAASPEILPDGSFLVLRINQERQRQLYQFWPQSGRIEPIGVNLWDGGPLYSGARTFPDGQQAALIGTLSNAPASDPLPHLYLLDIGTRRLRRLASELEIDRNSLAGSSLGISADGKSVLICLKSGDLQRITAIPRGGSSRARTIMTLTSTVWSMDVGPDGDLFVDQVDRPVEFLRFPVSGRIPERLGTQPGPELESSPIQFSDGRILMESVVSGRHRLMVAQPGKDPMSFVDTEEETSSPICLAGEHRVALMIGTGAERTIAIASTEDGRILARLQGAKGIVVSSMSIFPDGKEIYFTAGGNIWGVPVNDGTPRKIGSGDFVVADPRSGDLVVQLTENTGVHLFRQPITGGPPKAIPLHGELQLAPTQIASNAIGRDGRILVSVVTEDIWFYQTAILDPATGKVTLIPLDYGGDTIPPGWGNDGRIVADGYPLKSGLWRFRPVK